MADRSVNVRLSLDVAQFQRGALQAEQSNRRIASSAERAATQAQAASARTAAAVGGTFSGMSRQAQTSLTGVERAAGRSLQALANASRSMTAETARAADAAVRTTEQAAARSARASAAAASETARATERVAATAAELPATFRAAGSAGAAAMGEISAAATASSAALAGTETAMTAATAAAATGTAQLGLASRLALAEAAASSQAAAARGAAAARQIGTAASLAASGARRASEAASAAAERAAARSAAASTSSLSRIGARATAMAGSVAAASARSERSLKVTRNASLLLLAAFGAAAYAAMRFDKAMSNVAAVSGATGKKFDQMRSAALEAGKATQYSATQSADAEAELARAGVSVADIIGGALKGSLSLAAAGQLDLADSAVVAAQAMNTFHLHGQDVAHIADVLAAGANKSAADVHGLGMALRMGGLLAEQTGLSLEDTVGTLAAFADRALIGSDAGTSLKTMLQRLTPQSQQASDMMQRLGFSAYDSKGQFVGLEEMARRMQKSFANLTPEARNSAMGVIFGADAVRAATIMYQLGGDGIRHYVGEVNDIGAATRVAARQTDNLSGDFERLKGALEVALIQSGTAATGVLRGMAQWITKLINAYSGLPPELQSSVTLFSGIAGAVGLAAAGMLLMLPRVMQVRRELVALGVTAEATRTKVMALGRLGLVVGGLAAVSWGVEQLVKKLDPAPANITKLTASLVDMASGGKAAGEVARVLGSDLDAFGGAAHRLADPTVNDRIGDISWTVTHFGGDSHGLDQATDKIKSVDQSLADLVAGGHADVAAKSFDQLAKNADKHGVSLDKLHGLLPKYDDAITAADTQTKLAADGQKKLGDATQVTKDDLGQQLTEVQKLTSALDALNGKNISAAEGAIAYQASLGDLKKAVKDNGHSLDVTTEKGRAVRTAFLDAAKAAQAHAQAVADQKNSVAAGDAVLGQDIAQLRRAMLQAGFTTAQVDSLTRAYAQLPKSVTTKVTDPGAQQTIRDMERVKDRVANIPPGKSITTRALTKDAEASLKALGFKVAHMKGGRVRVTVPPGEAFNSVAAIEGRVQGLRDKAVDVYVREHIKAAGGRDSVLSGSYGRAAGGVIRRFAGGGVLPGYTPGRDVFRVPGPGGEVALSGGEAIMRPEWTRAVGPGAVYAMNALARRGGAAAVRRALGLPGYAAGGTVGGAMSSFTYTPSAPAVLGGTGDASSRYDAAIQALTDAWARYTAAVTAQRKAVDALAAAEANERKVRASQRQKVADAEEAQAKTRRNGARSVAAAEDNLARVRHGKHSHAQLIAAEKRLSDARTRAADADEAAAKRTTKAKAAEKAADQTAAGRTAKAEKAKGTADKAVKDSRGGILAADRALGVAAGAHAPKGFDLAAYMKQLADSAKATENWRKNLDAVGRRGGQQVRDILEGMGQDGAALTAALAKASGDDFATIVANLKKVQGAAAAALGDFDKQVKASNRQNTQFAGDLQALAARGFGSLAQQLASQGDQAAMDLAHQAAGASDAKVSGINSDVVAAGKVLTGDDLANSLAVLTTLRGGPNRGFAALLGAGLDMTTLRALIPRMLGQINKLPSQYRLEFLKEWAGQSGGMTAMARGGILNRPTVLAGEAGVRESYIPLNGSARSMALLGTTAGLMGMGLVPAGQYMAASGGGKYTGPREVHHHKTVVLNGAQQTAGEQAADILRRMTPVG